MTSKIIAASVTVCGLVVLLIALLDTGRARIELQAQSKSEASPELLAEGKRLYDNNCAVCHGIQGRGDGEAAYLLFPKPRDLTRGVFKIRSTPSGSLPTDNDIFRTITMGMAGTAMPSWQHLSERERWALVYYVKTLSPRFAREKPAEPIRIGQEPPPSTESIAAGREVYRKLQCGKCHGEAGRGDGPAAAELRDEWGFPIKPYDFTRGARLKGGATGAEIYRTFVTGMDGTPMPSFDFLPEAERWQLVHYVQSLSSRQAPLVEAEQVKGSILSKRVGEALPSEDPYAMIWDAAVPYQVPLRSLWLKESPIEKLTVRSIHNDRAIAFLLEWDDPARDADFVRVQDFRDAAAVQFALSEKEPFFGMGQKGGPVNIWHWKADWQMDLAARRDLEQVYSGMAWDYYPGKNNRPEQRILSALDHEGKFLAGLASGNLFSQPVRPSPIEDLNAEGLGTLTPQPPKSQNVKGTGVWREGRWRVLFVRPLSSPDKYDVRFNAGRTIPAAFAIWNGADGDRNGQKAVSVWYRLRIE